MLMWMDRLCLSIFIVNFEITVVSTSLVTITNDLGGFGHSSWIVTAYLFTYTGMRSSKRNRFRYDTDVFEGFIVIIAKISDVLGRKSMLFSSLLVFTIFSGACGAAQTITQLYVIDSKSSLGCMSSADLSLCLQHRASNFPRSRRLRGVLPGNGRFVRDGTTKEVSSLLHIDYSPICDFFGMRSTCGRSYLCQYLMEMGIPFEV
jgi:MFS family permease